MVSTQARIVKWICRFFVKRALMKPPKSQADGIRRLRRRLEIYDPLNRSFTRGCEIESGLGGVRGEWIVPPGAPSDRAILYLHGGAFVACSPLTHRRLTTALAKESGVALFAVDYRLAPEAPFPAALDDSLAGFDALRARGIPARNIAIAGDSAGGNLALAVPLALAMRASTERPAGVLAFSPWTDLAGTGASLKTNDRSDDMLVGTGITESARNYAATDQDLRNPLASPLYGDLAGFPATLVFASTSEILLDDARRFVERAKAAGATATLELESEMPHVWQIFYDFVPEAKRSVERGALFLRRVLDGTDSGTSRPTASSARP